MRVDGRAFAAGQAFLLSAKTYWTRVIYPAVREEYEKAPAALPQSVLYQYYCWLERHLQRYKYSGRYGLQAFHAQDRERLEQSLEPTRAELREGMEYPEYYTRVDIHQHPGGVWSDPIAGFVYERGARSTTPLAGKRHRDLHERLTAMALERCPGPSRVLDMGCGFGKSTRPFYETLDKAEIDAIDLSAPCLRLAARDAEQAGARRVRFRQMDCARTDYPAESFDLVTSTMLLHEMPPAVVEKTLAESARLLKPGGRMVHLDFLPAPDEFSRLIHFGHARRNNEPFMEPLARMDLAALLERLGLRNVEIRPFEEADGALAPGYRYWRFPWALISAQR
ncbi:MAG TPA: class I SAM-dependent methyltransferase [Burkholderiales bacterium]|nr:class I SAM-dependent methyltransferase [Burkholderiales bacterium]